MSGKIAGKFGAGLVLVILLFSSSPTHASTDFGVLPSGGLNGIPGLDYILGWEFSVSSSVTLNNLAYFDYNGDGLTTAHWVGIFDMKGNLLVDAVVPAGTGAALSNGFRLIPISFTLNPGTYVIAAQSAANSDDVLYRTSVIESPWITYVKDRYGYGLTFILPALTDITSEHAYFGPNFTLDPSPVPIPGAIWLLGSGLAGLGVVRLRLRRES